MEWPPSTDSMPASIMPQNIYRDLFPSLGLISSINDVHRNLERSIGMGFASQAVRGLTSSISSMSGIAKLGILNTPVMQEVGWVPEIVGAIEKTFGKSFGYQHKLLTGLFGAFEASQTVNRKQVGALIGIAGVPVGDARHLADRLAPLKNFALFGQSSMSQISSIAHQISQSVAFQVPDVTPWFLACVTAQAHSGLVDRLAATNIARAILVADRKFGEAAVVDTEPEGHRFPASVAPSGTSDTPIQETKAQLSDPRAGASFSEATTIIASAQIPPIAVAELVPSSVSVISESTSSLAAPSNQKDSSPSDRISAPPAFSESPVEIVREITEQLGEIQLLPRDEVSQALFSLSGLVADMFGRAFTATGSILKRVELVKWLPIVFAAIPLFYLPGQTESARSQAESDHSQTELIRSQTEFMRTQTELAVQANLAAKTSDGRVEVLLGQLVELERSNKSSMGSDVKELRIIIRSNRATVTPNGRAEVIALVSEGQLVEVIEVRRKWILVQFYDPVLDSHQRGWIMKKNSRTVRLDGLQVVRRP